MPAYTPPDEPARALWSQPLRRLIGELPFAWSAVRGSKPNGYPVLAYHSVATTSGRDVETVSPEAFEEQLDWLASRDFETETMSSLVNRLQDAASERPVVALTFDDGYEDNYTVALPSLKRHRAVATFYIATGYIGGKSLWNPESYIGHRPMMSAQQLRELEAAGNEIGSHGHRHAFMTELDDSAIESDLRESADRLGQILGHPVRGFAPPHGRSSNGIVDAARRCGFTHLVRGGRFALNMPGSSCFGLRRITIARNDSLREFAKKATGAYGFLGFRDG